MMDKLGMPRMLALLSFFLLFGILDAIAQENSITINVKNVSLDEVFKIIEKQTSYRFSYRDVVIDRKKDISISQANASITSILKEVLQGKNLEFSIISSKSIVISDKRSGATNTAKTKKISGIVKDETGEAIIGANVLVKGTTLGTVTDIDGSFTLNVPENSTLLISYIGYTDKTIIVKNQKLFNIELDASEELLDEVVVVGYGTQRKGNLTGAISSIKSDALTVAPIASTSNALAGRLPGLVVVQKSGQPGADAASLNIRGFGDALIIVDGIESSFNNLDPNIIESISILKDGSASIYGARAGNGVILVTTKRGISSKPKITLNLSATWQAPTAMLKPLTSGQSVELSRESFLHAGGKEEDAPYTVEQMNKYYEGTDPMYPNTDWYNYIFRNWSPQQQYNLSVRGGSEKIKYYGFLGMMDQQTMIKKNGGNYARYNLQSNIDATITEGLSFQLDLSAIHEDNNTTARNMGVDGYMWQDYWTTSPLYLSSFPDKTKVPFAGGGGTGGIHVTSNSELSGYRKTQTQKFNVLGSLNYNFQTIKGLSMKAMFNFAQNYSFSKRFIKSVLLYKWDPSSDVYTLSGSYGENMLDHNIDKNRTMTFQGLINYNRTFLDKHSVNASAVFECIDYFSEYVSAGRKGFVSTNIDYLFAGSTNGMFNGGGASEMGRMSFVGRVNYAYKNKYLLETILRADASAKFKKSERWGYFPSVSLGWVLTEEDFMKRLDFISNLKLRTSYGRSGNDAVGAFQYLSGYKYSALYMFGDKVQQSIATTGLANPYLTWETMDIYNVGVDFSFLKNSIYGEVEAFYRNRKGIPATRITTLPSTFGSALPQENINGINTRGFEMMLGYRNSVRDFNYDISANISYNRSKWGFYEEAEFTDPDYERQNKRTGNWVDRDFGYKSNGLFTSQEEIDNLGYNQDGQNNKTLKPGDIRIVDTNGDKIVDWKDQVEIGKGTTPHWMLGTNIKLSYKGFDLQMLFQGAFGFYKNFTMGAGSRQTFHERWTEKNNVSDALVPRVGSKAVTAGYFTDYSYKSSNYLRLKAASLGYNVPKNLISRIGLEKIRISLSGTNLFTVSKLYSYGIDPEAPNMGNYYPQQRTISIGLNLTL